MRALPGSHTRSTQWTDDSLESVHSNEWCTGEDWNLRTSQGGADLQSAGFNHSPTCAETPSPSVLPYIRQAWARRIMPCGMPCPKHQNTKQKSGKRAPIHWCAQNTTLGIASL